MVKQQFKPKIFFSVAYICIFLYCHTMLTTPTISLFFNPGADIDRYLKKIKRPGKLAKYSIGGLVHFSYTSGIIGTYAGYISHSDTNGQLSFPRKQESSDLFLVITPQIAPVIRFEQTVDHWQLIPGMPVEMFSVTETYNDKKKTYYWNIQPVDKPEDNAIAYSAIVIFAKPKNILVQTGQFEKRKNPNLILPPLYIQKGINIVKHATYILNMRHLFSNVKPANQKQPKHHQILLHE